MSTDPVRSAAGAEPHLGSGHHPHDHPHGQGQHDHADSEEADVRLMIEAAGGSAQDGQAVYTVVDRRTGRVISRILQDDLLRLKDKASYAAGSVYRGKA